MTYYLVSVGIVASGLTYLIYLDGRMAETRRKEELASRMYEQTRYGSCYLCGGNGRVYEHVQDDIGHTCWHCNGTGIQGKRDD